MKYNYRMELPPPQSRYVIFEDIINFHHRQRERIAQYINDSGLAELAWQNARTSLSQEELIKTIDNDIRVDLYEDRHEIGVRFEVIVSNEKRVHDIDVPLVNSYAGICISPEYEAYRDLVEDLIPLMRAINGPMIWIDVHIEHSGLTEEEKQKIYALKGQATNYFWKARIKPSEGNV